MKTINYFIIFCEFLVLACYADHVQANEYNSSIEFPKDNTFFKTPTKPIDAFRLNLNSPGEKPLIYSFGTNGFMGLAYPFNKITPYLFFSYDKFKLGGEAEILTQNRLFPLYGFSIDFKLTDSFYLSPTAVYRDLGKQSGLTNPDIDKEFIGSLQFRFLF